MRVNFTTTVSASWIPIPCLLPTVWFRLASRCTTMLALASLFSWVLVVQQASANFLNLPSTNIGLGAFGNSEFSDNSTSRHIRVFDGSPYNGQIGGRGLPGILLPSVIHSPVREYTQSSLSEITKRLKTPQPQEDLIISTGSKLLQAFPTADLVAALGIPHMLIHNLVDVQSRIYLPIIFHSITTKGPILWAPSFMLVMISTSSKVLIR